MKKRISSQVDRKEILGLEEGKPLGERETATSKIPSVYIMETPTIKRKNPSKPTPMMPAIQ